MVLLEEVFEEAGIEVTRRIAIWPRDILRVTAAVNVNRSIITFGGGIRNIVVDGEVGLIAARVNYADKELRGIK